MGNPFGEKKIKEILLSTELKHHGTRATANRIRDISGLINGDPIHGNRLMDFDCFIVRFERMGALSIPAPEPKDAKP